MRRAREGGGSAWTARAPLVRFLTRERQKKKKKKRRTAEEERTGVRGISRPARFREAAARGGVQAERRSAELEAGDQTGLSGKEKHRVIRRLCDGLMWRLQHQSSLRG